MDMYVCMRGTRGRQWHDLVSQVSLLFPNRAHNNIRHDKQMADTAYFSPKSRSKMIPEFQFAGNHSILITTLRPS